jgi:hypothetical protein
VRQKIRFYTFQGLQGGNATDKADYDWHAERSTALK